MTWSSLVLQVALVLEGGSGSGADGGEGGKGGGGGGDDDHPFGKVATLREQLNILLTNEPDTRSREQDKWLEWNQAFEEVKEELAAQTLEDPLDAGEGRYSGGDGESKCGGATGNGGGTEGVNLNNVRGFSIGIFDGIGVHGKTLIDTCAKGTVTFADTHGGPNGAAANPLRTTDDVRRYLTQYYAFVNAQIQTTTEPHPTKSGVLALSMFCGAGMFGVGYVGGRCCRAVYEGPEGRLAMRNVGDEHNFENEVEMERVKATGAEVKKWMVNNVGCVGDTCVWYGPGNPKCGRREPGLSTSRILGFSNATEVGVTAEPTVVVVDLSEPTDTVLYLAASSNFWKILDDDDVLGQLQEWFDR
jgi:hypothetical protein